MRSFDVREPLVQRPHNIPTFIDAQRGLRDIRQIDRVVHLQLFHIFDRRHQVKLVGNLTQRPDHFWVTSMTNEDQLIALRVVTVHFVVNFDHQGTGRINHMETTLICFFPDRLCHTVRTENHDRSFRDLAQLFHEDGALSPK